MISNSLRRNIRLLIWTEDIHDILFLIVLEIMKHQYYEIICVIPRKKMNRIQSTLITENQTKKSNIFFFILNSPILFYQNNKLGFKLLNKISLALRKIDNLFGLTWREFRLLFNVDSVYDLLILETPKNEEKLLVQRILTNMTFRKKTILLHDLSYIKSYTKNFDFFYKLNSFGIVDDAIDKKKIRYMDVQVSSNHIIESRTNQLLLLNQSKIMILSVIGVVSDSQRNYKKIIDNIPLDLKPYIKLVFIGIVADKSIVEYAISKEINLYSSFDFLITEKIQDLLIESHFTIYCPSSNSSHLSNSLSSTFIDSSRYCLPIISSVEPLNSVSTLILIDNNLSKLINYCYSVLLNGGYAKEFGMPSIYLANEKLKNYKAVFK